MANQYTAKSDIYRSCPKCLVPREAYGSSFSKHCNLCLGLNSDGKLVPHDHCLIGCAIKASKSPQALYVHYKDVHGEHLSQDHTIADVLRKHRPENFPDLDLHHNHGSLLSRVNPFRSDLQLDDDLSRHASMLYESPDLVHFDEDNILTRWADSFEKFFNTSPISLHGHASDAANPLLLTSVILHLWEQTPKGGKYSQEAKLAFELSKPSYESTRLAIVEGCYGATYGTLAANAVVDTYRAVACGSEPRVIRNDVLIDDSIKKAKKDGCVALILEIVRSSDGEVMAPEIIGTYISSCRKHALLLIVDESMTAIRCGAPFAHQLPQYHDHGHPDLIIFGKAVRTQGIAIDWKGINVQRLNLSSELRSGAERSWLQRFTQPASVGDLLTSWGTLLLAQKYDWPQRARSIGSSLREILNSDFRVPNPGGLHSLIYLPRPAKVGAGHQNSRQSRSEHANLPLTVRSAGAGPDWVRWLPILDEVMTSKEELEGKLFGLGSVTHRRQLFTYMAKNGWLVNSCSYCNNWVEGRIRPICSVCVMPQCEKCEPGEHQCPLSANAVTRPERREHELKAIESKAFDDAVEQMATGTKPSRGNVGAKRKCDGKTGGQNQTRFTRGLRRL